MAEESLKAANYRDTPVCARCLQYKDDRCYRHGCFVVREAICDRYEELLVKGIQGVCDDYTED